MSVQAAYLIISKRHQHWSWLYFASDGVCLLYALLSMKMKNTVYGNWSTARALLEGR